MKIEHVAIWVRDIDKVCEFYRKYFGGVVHPIYHNPTKQFTSRFITFDDGARLEIMHRPDIDSLFHVKPLQGECSAHTCMGITEPQEVGHEVSKQLQTEEAAGNSFTDISEVQQVGSEGANTIAKQDTQHLGFTHLSFSVGSKEEVDHLTQQMSSDGVTIVGQPRTTGDGYYESVVLDPERNRIEITI